jgi:hypothetical protein
MAKPLKLLSFVNARFIVFSVGCCWLALHQAACAAPTALAPAERSALIARYEHAHVALKVSCFYGDLYDDNEKWLLTPYPFSQTSHIVDLQDQSIHPKNERGVLPAGTTFIVERVEFPTPMTNFTRMLTSPRFNPWLYLRPTTPFADARDKRPFVIVLPTEDSAPGALQTTLDDMLGPPGAVAQWLDGLRPTVAVAIRHKDVVVGMNQAEMVASMGPPLRWFEEPATAHGPAVRVAWYPSLEAWFESDAITRVTPPRPPAAGFSDAVPN